MVNDDLREGEVMRAKPKALWAIQSPTLLNRLVCPAVWDMQVADMGDASGFDEIRLLRAPKWDGLQAGVEWAFVCSPAQYAWAKKSVPAAKVVQVLHQGYKFRAPVEAELNRAVVFSPQNLSQQMKWFPKAAIAHLVPSFITTPMWNWTKDDSWTLLSRPSQRHPMAFSGVHEILYLLGAARPKHAWYGQEQPGGFLNAAQLEAKHRKCSCYLTMLPPASGVGLAEHECLARGVPVVGFMPNVRTTTLSGDFWDFEAICEHLSRCCLDHSYAKLSSQSGLDYISRCCTRENLEVSIRDALDILA